MNMELGLLLLTVVSIGFIHTVLGPDHYLPFVAMSAASNWTRRKTLLVTAFCGVGHVLGSIVIGFVGIAIGAWLHRLQWLEDLRGDLAAWVLFVIFILGPCEALIPLLMYPASQHSGWGLTVVVLAFATATIATMTLIVYRATRGLERFPLASAERYVHALAGAARSLCGVGIVLGL